MESNRPIGGFYELEIPKKKGTYHSKALALTNGRACLSLILDIEKPTKVYIPFYTCFALYEPLIKKNIEVAFYAVDENLEPKKLPVLKDDELFVYINYFGIKDRCCAGLIEIFNDKLVIDDTHQFFNKGYKANYSFTSARKYFGVPDGAYLYLKNESENDYNFPRPEHISLDHNVGRLEENYSSAYESYLLAEGNFGSEVLKISKISEKILETINYQFVKSRRTQNFMFLHDKFKYINQFELDDVSVATPFCYPLVLNKIIDKRLFHESNIFIPTLWPDISSRSNLEFDFENGFANRLLPLPIDHRYDESDMKRLTYITERIINE